MPVVRCPIEDCEYQTPDVDPVVAAALITTHDTVHASPHLATPVAKAEKVKRPCISSSGTTEDWHYFISRWSDYVKATKLSGTDRVIQLLECCDDQLRRDLTRNAGGTLTGKTENEVLAAMKILAVREENVMVARVTLHNMKQDRGEPIRAFGARLRGQAGVCKFTQQCTNCQANVDYTEAILRDVLCRGLEDSEIQLELLGDKNQDMTLEQTLRFVEAKEAGKRSATRLLLPHATDAITGSTYKRQKRDAAEWPSSKDQDSCSYCGKRGHGKNAPTRLRRKECPAYGTVCSHCNKDHHFESACRGKVKNKSNKTSEQENPIFDTLCELTIQRNVASIPLGHHVYDQLSGRWLKRPSKSQPFTRLSIEIRKEDYEHFGFQLSVPSNTIWVDAMADTGCQSCLAGSKLIEKLKLFSKDLIPVNMQMHSADNRDIPILGAIILRLSGKDQSGGERTTRQIIYITDSTDKLFLSRGACVDLGIVSTQFPVVGEVPIQADHLMSSTADSVSSPQDETALDCNCPKRTKPPPLPASLPCPATEENIMQLKQYLLDYYSSSTFNTCEHQPLPMMEGPPMRLMIDPEAKPTAYHSPIPVPIHWQDDVKAGLDRDVRLGVLEPVPVGEPVTWCDNWSSVPRKMGSLGGQLTFSHLIVMPPGKPIILSPPFIRLDQFLMERRKQYLMLGTVTIVFHSTLTTATIPHLLPHGADIDIVLLFRDTLLQGMVTQGVMMKL